MKKEEYEQFNKVVDEVLLPILEEHKEDIDKILDNNPDFKSEIESKVEAILVKRKKTILIRLSMKKRSKGGVFHGSNVSDLR